MIKKIIGNTVGTTLPKPNLNQTDPTKGDYVKGKEEFAQQYVRSVNGATPDENGNVEVAAQVHPDMAQNDSTKADYVKNRTHWEEGAQVTIEWDGSTMGRRTWVSGGGGINSIQYTYYKIADLCPGEEDVIGSVIELSNGNTITITNKHFSGFTNGVAYVDCLCLINRPNPGGGTTIDPDFVGVYARNDDGVYPARYTYGSVTVHQLDEKFIPDTIARKTDLPDSSQNVDLTGYATEQYVQEYAQHKGDYLASTELPTAIDTALAQAKASGEFDGADGKDGYTPVKGKDYFDGQPGKDGIDGKDGYTPVKGKDYFDGEDGQPGEDGNGIKSAVLNADYTLTLTFDDGTSYTTPSIRGATGSAGKDGQNGSNGSDGVGIASIKQTTTSTADGGNNVFTVTLTNGTSATFTVKNGSKGSTGSAGNDGVSATHSWNGTVLTVTSASGTSSADLKGAKGDKGDKGDSIKGDKGDKGDPGEKYVLTEADLIEISNRVLANFTDVSEVAL